MKDKLFFEIPPDDLGAVVKLIEAVPLECGGWISGQINAPETLIVLGEAEEETGFELGLPGITIQGNNPNAIMVRAKLPGFIRFNGVVCDESVKKIIVGFLQKRYRGRLMFQLDGYNQHSINGPALCEINFEPWQGKSFYTGEEIGMQPARLMLQRTDTDSAKSIIARCHDLNLREYVLGSQGQPFFGICE